MTEEDRTGWMDRIDKARAAKKAVVGWWDANLKTYAPDPTSDPDQYGQTLNTNRDFTLVERKKADLFYQKPDVTAIPSPLFAGQEALLDTHTQILNEKLGLNGVHVKALVHQVLFDVLCPSGTGWTVMGYESTTVDTPITDPQTGQPAIDPTTGQPQTAPVPVFEDCFWRWLSPRAALVPHDFRSTRWNDAPWLGYEFELPIRTAQRKEWVDDQFTGSSPSTDIHFTYGGQKPSAEAVVRGVMVFYYSALFRDDQVHPQHQTMLVFIDGVQDPVDHKDSPYQTLDSKAVDGMTADSLIGFPIHPCTTRVLSDSAFPPSDATITRPTVNELNKTRGQMIEYREANILRWQYNTDTLPTDALNKIVRSPIGGFVGLPGEAFVGEGAIKELPHGSYPRENFQFSDSLDNDLARAWALDANQVGVNAGGDSTATEAQLVQNNANARLGLERGNVLDWYLAGVTKYSTLLQRFLTVQQAAAIVGTAPAQAWDQWRHTIPSSLAFTALPDSAQRTDLAVDRKRAMDEYTFFANDPYINRVALLKVLLPKLRYPQSVINQQPPAKQPEPMRISLAIVSTSLNPLLPEYANLYQVLTQQGVTGLAPPQPEAILNQPVPTQTAHGGKVAPLEGLSKHATDLTGGMPGTGQPAPMGGIQ